MSRPSSETGAALAFLEHMFDSSSQSHLVAIDVAGKVIARSFSPSEREAASAWIVARHGIANLYRACLYIESCEGNGVPERT
jgi:hypothetical protein